MMLGRLELWVGDWWEVKGWTAALVTKFDAWGIGDTCPVRIGHMGGFNFSIRAFRVNGCLGEGC